MVHFKSGLSYSRVKEYNNLRILNKSRLFTFSRRRTKRKAKFFT